MFAARRRRTVWLTVLVCISLVALASAGGAQARVLDAPLREVLPGQIAISASAGPGGSISPTGEVGVDPGASQDFTIAADTGHHIDDVVVDDVSQGAIGSYTFTTVDAAHTIAATFAIDTFTITATAGPNGSITPGTGSVAYGLEPGVTPSRPPPATTSHRLTVDGQPQTPQGSWLHVQQRRREPLRFPRAFAIDTFTITATAGANGSITPGTVLGRLRLEPDLHHHARHRLPHRFD